MAPQTALDFETRDFVKQVALFCEPPYSYLRSYYPQALSGNHKGCRFCFSGYFSSFHCDSRFAYMLKCG